MFFDDAKEFFEHLGRCGAAWWFVDAQPRKLDGQRGAPIAARFGIRHAYRCDKVVDGFVALSERLEKAGKTRVDLQTRESPSHAGARAVLVDDLAGSELNALRAWWPGAGALLETSPSNFQAILVAPRPLEEAERAGLAQAAARLFHGDLGAVGARQLHRFPGSPNFKQSALVGGLPFYCRLVSLFDVEFDSFSVAELLADMPPTARTKATQVGRALAVHNTPEDHSARAYRWTQDRLRDCTPDAVIQAGLRSPLWLSHHDPDDWPARTLQNAKFALGMASSRYKSGR